MRALAEALQRHARAPEALAARREAAECGARRSLARWAGSLCNRHCSEAWRACARASDQPWVAPLRQAAAEAARALEAQAARREAAEAALEDARRAGLAFRRAQILAAQAPRALRAGGGGGGRARAAAPRACP